MNIYTPPSFGRRIVPNWAHIDISNWVNEYDQIVTTNMIKLSPAYMDEYEEWLYICTLLLLFKACAHFLWWFRPREWSFHSGQNGMTIPFQLEWIDHSIPAGMKWPFHSTARLRLLGALTICRLKAQKMEEVQANPNLENFLELEAYCATSETLCPLPCTQQNHYAT